MKRILIGLFAFFLLSSTAYAATSWGNYKGRPIVTVIVNGQKVNSAVPGQIIDNATLLPLRAIGDALGAKVEWNQATRTATLTTPEKPVEAVKTGLSLEELNRIGESVGIIYAYSGDQYVGQGSGFVVDNKIITNWHVLEKATQFIVAFETQETTIQVNDALFKNESADLIGFRLEGYPGLKLSTEDPKTKDKVYALGYPHRKFTITEGMFVSHWGDIKWVHSAKTSAGASGGVLINMNGEVIGVTSSSNDSESINLAVRSEILGYELNNIN